MSINYAELALIELEYSVADRSDRRSATSDPSKPTEITLRLPNILIAVEALRFALDAMQVAFDRKGSPARPGELRLPRTLAIMLKRDAARR
jgi:hypothetical protein